LATDESSSTGSSTNWAFNLVPDPPVHVYWSTFYSPARHSAQVPNHVMIWLALHWSERQTVFDLWALVYGSQVEHLVLSEL
jgi:hypothetical protein